MRALEAIASYRGSAQEFDTGVLDSLFGSSEPPRILYSLQNVFARVQPVDDGRSTGVLDRFGRSNFSMQFVHCGGLNRMLQLLQPGSLAATHVLSPQILFWVVNLTKNILDPIESPYGRKLARSWTNQEVQYWLQNCCFSKLNLVKLFQQVDGEKLVSVTQEELLKHDVDAETAADLRRIVAAWDQPVGGKSACCEFLPERLLDICWTAGCGRFDLYTTLDAVPQAWLQLLEEAEGKISPMLAQLAQVSLRLLLFCASSHYESAIQLVTLEQFRPAVSDLLLRCPQSTVRARTQEWLLALCNTHGNNNWVRATAYVHLVLILSFLLKLPMLAG